MPSHSVSQIHAGGLFGRLYSREAASPPPPSADPAPVYVLVHGIGASHRYLDRLQLKLSAASDTLSFDLPGFAGTARPDAQLSVGDYARFVAAVLAERNVRNCVVVGHSMGCQIAVELALQQPALVSRVVLMGPVVDPERRSVRAQMLALGRDVLKEPLSANTIVFSDYVRCGLRWYLTELPVMMGYRTEDVISAVAAPVLVLRGSRDPVADRLWSQRLADTAPNGYLREMRGKRHVVQHAVPDEVAAAIISFAAVPPLAPGLSLPRNDA